MTCRKQENVLGDGTISSYSFPPDNSPWIILENGLPESESAIYELNVLLAYYNLNTLKG